MTAWQDEPPLTRRQIRMRERGLRGEAHDEPAQKGDAPETPWPGWNTEVRHTPGHHSQPDPEQTDSGQTSSGQTDSGQTSSGQTDSEQTNSERPDSAQSDSEQPRDDQPRDDKSQSGRTPLVDAQGTRPAVPSGSATTSTEVADRTPRGPTIAAAANEAGHVLTRRELRRLRTQSELPLDNPRQAQFEVDAAQAPVPQRERLVQSRQRDAEGVNARAAQAEQAQDEQAQTEQTQTQRAVQRQQAARANQAGQSQQDQRPPVRLAPFRAEPLNQPEPLDERAPAALPAPTDQRPPGVRQAAADGVSPDFVQIMASPSIDTSAVTVIPTAIPVARPIPDEHVRVHEDHAPPFGHWSTQGKLDDQNQILDHSVRRDLSTSSGAITTSALVLPSVPHATDITRPISSTGEILITGTIDLPSSLGSTGSYPTNFDRSDVDAIIAADDREDTAADSAPVRAIRAVSTSNATPGMIGGKKSKESRLPLVLPIVASAIGVGVVVLFVIGFLFKAF